MDELNDNLDSIRSKRNEINLLLNKELNIKNGAQNMLNVSLNEQSKEKLKLEIIFAKSNITYLRDKLAELNCYWTLKDLNDKRHFMKSVHIDVMIYLMPRDTLNDLDFKLAFDNAILSHYKENPLKYANNIECFNDHRKFIVKISHCPSLQNINHLFEYLNSLDSIEKRFFKSFECDYVFFKWYDNLNGVQSMQKSIQFEKACILFNCASLYTQMTLNASCDDQILYWQKAAGCLTLLSSNYSFYTPSLEMCNIILNMFYDIFICQAYEIKCKLMLEILNKSQNLKLTHSGYINCSKIFAWVLFRLNDNFTIKNYIPEVWLFLLKTKSVYYQALSHYYASFSIQYTNLSLPKLDFNEEMNLIFKDFYAKKTTNDIFLRLSLVSNSSNKIFLKTNLARYHLKKSLLCLEEAIRQHSFCRKFSKQDNLYKVLKINYFKTFEKLTILKEKLQELNRSCHPIKLIDDYYNDDLIEMLSINTFIPEALKLKAVKPNLKDYKCEDFFEKIAKNQISLPFTCILKKQNQSFGLTVKGDCPVRINQIDPNFNLANKNINEGDYITEIDGEDVKWLRHNEVVEKFRSKSTIKLTLIRVKPIKNESTFILNEYMKRITQRNNNINSHKKPFNTTRIKYPTNYIDTFIHFNEEDDEIRAKKPNNNKTYKNFLKDFNLITFAHTITFGRKFKKIVSLNKLEQCY